MKSHEALFLGVWSPAGFIDGTMMTPERCIIRAVMGYVKALSEGEPLASYYWELSFQLEQGKKGKIIRMPIIEWWHLYATGRKKNPNLTPLPLYSSSTLVGLIEEFLGDGGLSQEQRMFLMAIKARVLSVKLHLSLMESAAVGGLYREVCAFREVSPPRIRNDELLERIVSGIRHQRFPDLIREAKDCPDGKKAKSKREKRRINLFKPVMTNDRIRYYNNGEFPPHDTFSLASMRLYSTGYMLFVWSKPKGGVVAVADCIRLEGGLAYIFEAESAEALIAYFAKRPRRDALRFGSKRVIFCKSVYHHRAGKWRDGIRQTVNALLES